MSEKELFKLQLFKCLVMPYGLVSAPFVFLDFMHNVLWEFLYRFVIVYINNIPIYSGSQAEHCQQFLNYVIYTYNSKPEIMRIGEMQVHQSTKSLT